MIIWKNLCCVYLWSSCSSSQGYKVLSNSNGIQATILPFYRLGKQDHDTLAQYQRHILDHFLDKKHSLIPFFTFLVGLA